MAISKGKLNCPDLVFKELQIAFMYKAHGWTHQIFISELPTDFDSLNQILLRVL